MLQAPYFGAVLPNAVVIKIIENYLLKTALLWFKKTFVIEHLEENIKYQQSLSVNVAETFYAE